MSVYCTWLALLKLGEELVKVTVTFRIRVEYSSLVSVPIPNSGFGIGSPLILSSFYQQLPLKHWLSKNSFKKKKNHKLSAGSILDVKLSFVAFCFALLAMVKKRDHKEFAATRKNNIAMFYSEITCISTLQQCHHALRMNIYIYIIPPQRWGSCFLYSVTATQVQWFAVSIRSSVSKLFHIGYK